MCLQWGCVSGFAIRETSAVLRHRVASHVISMPGSSLSGGPKIRREHFDEALLSGTILPSRRPKDCQFLTTPRSTMISRSSLARHAQQAARRSWGAQSLQQRSFAAAASTGAFETSDISGLKVASRDAHGPTTKLAIVAKAGTRYQPLPGLTVGLEEFAFKVRIVDWTCECVELICPGRTPSDALLSESPASPSSLAVNWVLRTPVRPLCSRLASSAMTSPTLPSSWPRSCP